MLGGSVNVGHFLSAHGLAFWTSVPGKWPTGALLDNFYKLVMIR
jgi:hypothetical protein